VTIFGNSLVPSSTIDIKYDGTTLVTTPSTVTSSPTGSFSATFTVPTSSTSSHIVSSIDPSGNLLFTAFSAVSSGKAMGGSVAGTSPSFTTRFAHGQYPVTINGQGFNLTQYRNKVPTQQIQTGNTFSIKILLYGDYGPSFVQHVGLYTNLHDKTRDIQDSDTSIVWDKNSLPEVTDPNKFFSNITVNSTQNNGKFELDITGVFARPMPKSDIAIRTWGQDRYSADTYLLDAWEATESGQIKTDPSNIQPSNIQPSNIQPSILQIPPIQSPQPSIIQTDLMAEIKKWGGYAPQSISDSQLLQDMGLQGKHIPSWFTKTVKWLVDGTISQQDFENALKYMSQNGILK
ncbi:MAG TPA: hypothetical protein VFG24_08265, partial [Nitrosopumilaceae archaeon]|nr:hypothetical protein [Nitrosopumilaceae archaeon]